MARDEWSEILGETPAQTTPAAAKKPKPVDEFSFLDEPAATKPAAPVAAAPRPVAVKPTTVKPTVAPTASTPVAAPTKKRKQQFEELPEGGFVAVLRGPEEAEEPTPAPIVAPVKVPQAGPFDAYKAGMLPPGSPVTKEGEAVSNPQYARATELYRRKKEIESTMGLPPEKAIEYLTTELVDQKAPELRLGQYAGTEGSGRFHKA